MLKPRMTSPDLEQVTALADQQRGDLGAVEHRAAAHREADAGADEEAAEHRGEQPIRRHVGKVDGRQRGRQAGDRQRAADRECAAHLAVADRDERRVHQRQPHRSGSRRHLDEQHRDAGDAAVDEVAGEEKTLEAERRSENPQRDQQRVQGFSPHDAVYFELCATTPQATRSPALPAGSVFRSSTPACTTSAAVDAHLHVRRDHGRLGGAVLEHREVVHVAGVRTFRVLQAVLLAFRIVVAAGRRERRAFATRLLVEVDRVTARRQFFRSSATDTPPSLAARASPSRPPGPGILQLDRRRGLLRGNLKDSKTTNEDNRDS